MKQKKLGYFAWYKDKNNEWKSIWCSSQEWAMDKVNCWEALYATQEIYKRGIDFDHNKN